jgi:hypothetical protein
LTPLYIFSFTPRVKEKFMKGAQGASPLAGLGGARGFDPAVLGDILVQILNRAVDAFEDENEKMRGVFYGFVSCS